MLNKSFKVHDIARCQEFMVALTIKRTLWCHIILYSAEYAEYDGVKNRSDLGSSAGNEF